MRPDAKSPIIAPDEVCMPVCNPEVVDVHGFPSLAHIFHDSGRFVVRAEHVATFQLGGGLPPLSDYVKRVLARRLNGLPRDYHSESSGALDEHLLNLFRLRRSIRIVLWPG